MKYQVIKHLKTKTKVLDICDTMNEADRVITEQDAMFKGFAYIGGFPIFYDDIGRRYSIQGLVPLVDGGGVVCSIPHKELKIYN